jgi:carbon-monoxide dehydrogenase medium subunit
MKSAAFEYRRATSLLEASRLLAEHEDARLIAGGQTLVPMMAMRLARPALLIDISRLEEIQQIEVDDGVVSLGAGVRQAHAEADPLVARALPLLAKALPFVGHAPTRNRGTVGGSVANADPAAEIPLVLTTLAGHIRVQDGDTRYDIAASDFFEGPMMTSLGAQACIASLRFPIWREANHGCGFLEVSARQSDFAYVSAAAQVALDDNGACLRCAIGIGGATPVPTRLDAVAAALAGSDLADAAIEAAVKPVIEDLEIMIDAHASETYRRRVAATFAVRALQAARDEARARLKGARA